MKHKMKSEYGDISGDGHSQSDDLYWESNYSPKKIDKMWKKVCIKFAISFNHVYGEDKKVFTEIAVDYEDSQLSYEAYEKLIMSGVDPFDGHYHLNITEEEYEDLDTYIEDYEHLWIIQMKMIKAIHPEFKYKQVHNDTPYSNVGGGYGLYY